MANVKISDMTPGSTLTGAETLEMVQGGATRSATATQLQRLAHRDAYAYNAPLTGAAITVTAGDQHLVLNPAGTIATLTVTLPAAPADGDTFGLSTTQTVTALTMAGNGATISGAATTLTASTFPRWIYRAANTTWYRIG